MNYTELNKMPEQSCLIYTIKNKTNGHSYVGSTVEPARRWKNHSSALASKLHSSPLLQQAWNKYGAESFDFLPLLVCPKDLRHEYETLAIKAAGYYNLLKIAGSVVPGAMSGKSHSKQGKKNLSTGAKRRWALEKQLKYEPLCKQAWDLVCSGIPRYKACKQVGLSHSTFWRWLEKNGGKEGVRGRKKAGSK